MSISLFGFPSAASAASNKASAHAPLDTAKIHADYLEGDFDSAIRALESQLKSNAALSRGDSVFVFKHLGVMYAASPATREKGRYYMYQLISIEPTAKILDMYASDMIYLIFRNVQEQYETERSKNALAAPAAAPSTASASGPAQPASGKKPSRMSRRKLYWIAGGVGAAVGAVGLVVMLTGEDDPKTQTIIIKE